MWAKCVEGNPVNLDNAECVKVITHGQRNATARTGEVRAIMTSGQEHQLFQGPMDRVKKVHEIIASHVSAINLESRIKDDEK